MTDFKPGDLLSTSLARIVSHIRVENRGFATPCWITDYYHDPGGYVGLRSGGRMQKLHRLTFEALVEAIPSGKHIDHLCRVRGCCNPGHLEPVSPAENTLRGLTVTAANAAKTHCDHGHEFTPSNTYIRSDGSRRCRTCQRRVRLANYYKKRVLA